MMTNEAYEALEQAAREAGAVHGRDAAIGFVKTAEYARVLLNALDEGDPEVLDTLPMLDLSGSYADGTTDADVLGVIGRKAPAYADRLDEAFLLPEESDGLIEAFRTAYDEAVSEKIEADCIEIKRAVIVEDIESFTAFRLANEADTLCPDDDSSAGAQFLRHVRDAFVEALQAGDFDEPYGQDRVTEIADGAPDVYTHTLFAEFVDLGAYREDISDYVDGLDLSNGLDRAASIALYVIAERLVYRLAELAGIEF